MTQATSFEGGTLATGEEELLELKVMELYEETYKFIALVRNPWRSITAAVNGMGVACGISRLVRKEIGPFKAKRKKFQNFAALSLRRP